jgi:hypothetical protein
MVILFKAQLKKVTAMIKLVASKCDGISGSSTMVFQVVLR